MDSVITLSASFIADGKRIFTRAEKIFELSNHLGNVLVTLSDRRVQHSAGGTTVDYYQADLASANDYYPFGMMMPARKYSSSASYRYGFNGKENDNVVKGLGNQQDYGMRIYDARFGRFLSVDPLMKEYPELTPYQFASNTPVQGVDLDGEEVYHYTLLLQDGKKPVLTYLGVQIKEHAVWEVFDNENDFESFNGDVITTKSIQVHAIIRDGNGICHAPTVSFSYFKELIDWTESGFEGSNELKAQAELTKKELRAFGLATIARGTFQAGTSTKMPGSITPRSSGTLKSNTGTSTGTNKQATAANGGNTQAAAANKSVTEWKGPVDYSKLKQPLKVGPGLETTPAQRQRILEYNKKMNGGVLRSDIDGSVLDMPASVPKGSKANMNQAEVDHIRERVIGGSNSNSNLRVISKDQNLKKESQRRRG